MKRELPFNKPYLLRVLADDSANDNPPGTIPTGDLASIVTFIMIIK